MSESSQLLREDITRLLDTVGLASLIVVSSAAVRYSEKPLALPHLSQVLQKKGLDYGLLCSFSSLEQAVSSLETMVHGPLPVSLHIPGIRHIEPSTMNHVRFKGGSYSTTFASYHDNHWRVIKQCKVYNHPDKDLRLKLEMESIAGLPVAAHALFPHILHKELSPDLLRYEIEYVPYHNFAEIVSSGEYDDSELSRCLRGMYDKLFEVLYKPNPSIHNSVQSLDYVAIIRRRLAEVSQLLSADNFLHRLLAADELAYNGSRYPGVSKTLQLADAFLASKTTPNTYNHGDLILQDILLDPASGDFRLVDSNGLSTGYIHDFAKTLLCLETKYDLLYDGKFTLDLDLTHAKAAKAELNYTDQGHEQRLDKMNEYFWDYLETHEAEFRATLPEWHETLNVLCGLQNIAIVMFHTLHHQKHERAAAFLLNGIKLINDTLSDKS